MLAAPAETIEVESVLKKHRGLSSNNPHLQPTTMTYSYELVPSEIAERVIDSALQIAREWVEDCRVLMDTDEVWRQRRAAVTRDDTELRETLPNFSIDQDAAADSPYRGGNWDLLQCLALRQAALAALREMEVTLDLDADMAQLRGEMELLRSHCATLPAVGEEIPRHAAETWLSTLLELPISLRMPVAADDERDPRADGDATGAGAVLVDPRSIAERVLEYRAGLAAPWIEELEAMPEYLLELKREHLRSRTGL